MYLLNLREKCYSEFISKQQYKPTQHLYLDGYLFSILKTSLFLLIIWIERAAEIEILVIFIKIATESIWRYKFLELIFK